MNDKTLFRSVWKGSDGLASRGRLRMDVFAQKLHALGWRDLGLLLVHFVRPLTDSVPDHSGIQYWMPWIRCLIALSGTITHMHTLRVQAEREQPGAVNPEFVAKMVAAIKCSTSLVREHAYSEYPMVAPIVFKCVSCVLAPDHRDSKQRFAANAVLDGLIAPSASPSDRPATKRRRTSEPSFLGLLADTLSDSSVVRTHAYVVRILRARNSAVVSRNTDQAAAIRLVSALTELSLKLCASDMDMDETYAGSVFACIRDTMDQVDAPSDDTEDLPLHVVATTQMLLALAALFRSYVTRADPVSLYVFCAEKRHRCYQWAALCRAATWISGYRNVPKPAEALAECSRLCWIQITDNATPDVQIWSLLLSESLGHIALCAKPLANAPLFMASLDAQTLVFAALAPLLARITDTLPTVASNKVAHPLVLASLRMCDKILRHISPHAASMGVFRPASQCTNVVREEGAYRRVLCTLDAYVFRPTLLSRDSPTQADEANEEHSALPELSVERVREEEEEIGREIVLGAVFDSAVAVANMISEPGVDHSAHSLAFRALMRWIGAFTKSARDNAGAQARQLESQKRINIGVVGDKTRMLQSATDWSRLQRVPIVRRRQPANDSASDSVRRTYKPVAAQAIRLFAALSLWPVLGTTCHPLLERCLVWSDTEPTVAYSAEQTSHFCEHLKDTVSDRAFENLAFSSLQILASILGVRSHLFAQNLRLLRLPHLQVRSHSPQSSEALMQLAMKTGLCNVLLEPAFLVRSIDSVSTNGITNPLALCAGQMWLDMVGNVVRHSLFRTYAGLAYSAKDAATVTPSLPFTVWWSLALASSTRCLLAVLDTDQNVDHIRLACILPSHLVSWHLFIPISDSSIRSFVNSPTSNADLDRVLGDPLRFKSIISVVHFLACNLWREFRILDQEEDFEKLATVCRDVWGIASDSVHLLQRMLQHGAVRRMFVDLGLIDELMSVVCDLVARQNIPRLILRILKVLDLPNDEPEPDPLGSMLLKISEDLDLVSDSDDTARVNTDGLNPDDVVEKLLHVTALHRTPAKQRALAEYYSPDILARLWSTFIDEVLVLPVRIALVALSKHGTFGQQTDVLEWIDDTNGVLFRTLSPLLAVKEHLMQPCALWQAIEAAAPLESLATVINERTADMLQSCVSVAFVLPDLAETDVSPNGQLLVSIVLTRLVRSLNNDDGTSAAALVFMAWRQRTLVEQHIRRFSVRLQHAKNEMLEKLADTLHAIGPEGPDLVLLCGTNMQNHPPIRTSLIFLSQHSEVFRAMFSGKFSEAQVVQSGVQQVHLQDSHTTLMGLISTLHECTSTNEPSAQFDIHHIVRVLALAIFYDARPAILLLVWRLCEKYDDISSLSDDLLDELGAMFGENWALYLNDPNYAHIVRCLLASVMVLHMDRIDVLGAIEFNVSLFIDSVTYIFQK
ncbi:hypothetical protein GGH96_002566 [Coemansia sp. RSA 1972]|nr:hypothetical protein GGH96_002566 [Coemansia sp. RSA 1972]